VPKIALLTWRLSLSEATLISGSHEHEIEQVLFLSECSPIKAQDRLPRWNALAEASLIRLLVRRMRLNLSSEVQNYGLNLLYLLVAAISNFSQNLEVLHDF